MQLSNQPISYQQHIAEEPKVVVNVHMNGHNKKIVISMISGITLLPHN